MAHKTLIVKPGTGYCKKPGDIITTALEVLDSGGLIVYPTDTVYGITGKPTKEGLEAVYQAKGRDHGKPTPILLSEAHIALKLVEVNALFWKLTLKYWPGRLTIISKRNPSAPAFLSSWEKIGIRLPDHPIPRLLASSLGGFIIGTSANISGKPTPSSPIEIERQLREKWDGPLLIIDCGSIRGLPSTVIEIVDENSYRIIRRGAVAL